MPLKHENRLFWMLFVGSYKEVLIKNLKFVLFPTYVPVTLLKSKLQIRPANPINPDILIFITKFL